jgi:dTDP-4-dehydrorhamnose 3,5-epimerase
MGESLQRIDTEIPGVCLIQPAVFRDNRGFFLESYEQRKFAKLGIADTFVQDNHSSSTKGVLRGLHYQLRRPQAKLCRVVEGEVLDVVVDIRDGSPTFGKWIITVLSAERQNQIYVPKGFAHGFLAIADKVQFLYKCSVFYDAADEYGVLWNDAGLSISWGVSDPVLSTKDKQFLPLPQIPQELLPRYPF